MSKPESWKKSEKRRKRALKPAVICYALHGNEAVPNRGFKPHVHAYMTNNRGVPVTIRWEVQAEYKKPIQLCAHGRPIIVNCEYC